MTKRSAPSPRNQMIQLPSWFRRFVIAFNIFLMARFNYCLKNVPYTYYTRRRSTLCANHSKDVISKFWILHQLQPRRSLQQNT